MAISLRAAGIGAIALGTALAGAYQLGRSNGGAGTSVAAAAAPAAGPVAVVAAPAVPATPAASDAMPAGHPAPAEPQREGKLAPDPSQKFTHFRVGNKNVKRIFVDGDTVWVGTSGGAVRYDTQGRHDIAPGLAGRPRAMTSARCSERGSNTGCSRSLSRSGTTRCSAVGSSIHPALSAVTPR